MKKTETFMNGLYVIDPFVFEDERGSFVKVFNNSQMNELDLNADFKESFYSISKKNVIRGMHFQTPPYDHDKLVSVNRGKILDVVVDLRKDSKTYKEVYSIELSSSNNKMLYIPKGFAHGFLSLEDDTMVTYHVTTGHSKEQEGGVLYSSINFDWGIEKPIVSLKDQQFETVDQYQSPF
jgi:dTDP-4-dehydrorhamnose 3,5-epimerase